MVWSSTTPARPSWCGARAYFNLWRTLRGSWAYGRTLSQVRGGGTGRVYAAGQQFPGLAVSRAFGDADGKKYGVTVDPQFIGWKFRPENDWCVASFPSRHSANPSQKILAAIFCLIAMQRRCTRGVH